MICLRGKGIGEEEISVWVLWLRKIKTFQPLSTVQSHDWSWSQEANAFLNWFWCSETVGNIAQCLHLKGLQFGSSRGQRLDKVAIGQQGSSKALVGAVELSAPDRGSAGSSGHCAHWDLFMSMCKTPPGTSRNTWVNFSKGWGLLGKRRRNVFSEIWVEILKQPYLVRLVRESNPNT